MDENLIRNQLLEQTILLNKILERLSALESKVAPPPMELQDNKPHGVPQALAHLNSLGIPW